MSNPDVQLTRRERAVVEALLSGLSDKEVGTKLGISHKTVSTLKVTARDRVGAVTFCEAVAIIVATRIVIFEPRPKKTE